MKVIGLMSGTSVDAIDGSLAEIDEAESGIRLTPLTTASRKWSRAERDLIDDLIQNRGDSRALCRAQRVVGLAFAQTAMTVIEASGLTLSQIDLIGSHGQTLWHEVEDGQTHSTLQIGEAAHIAEITGVTTVSDFRQADIAAGGQGAPLVSILDWLLLRPPAGSLWRALQNIGGIGNVTFLPPMGTEAAPLAFDSGPGNTLIDWGAKMVSDGALDYDKEGRMASRGVVDQSLLGEWLSLDYFDRPPPKSTGRELFSAKLAQTWWQQASSRGAAPHDFVATVTELTAQSIAQAYARFAPGPIGDVAIAGGGGRNPYLVERILFHLHQELDHRPVLRRYAELSDPSISGESKEALTFALLAWLTISGRPGNVPACTGAKGERILGKITPGLNFPKLVCF